MATADEKRLQSLIEKKNVYKQQKNAIQQALLNIDSKPKNKIIFSDDDRIIDDHKPLKRNLETNHVSENNLEVKKSNKLLLFDEDNESDNDLNENFKIKNHFEGKEGKKLLELQSKYKSDKRFTLDSRFLEKDDNSEDNKNLHNSDVEITEANEKEHQLQILQNVLGVKINARNSEKPMKPKMTMLRFDPSKADHSKFEMKKLEPTLDKETKKKKKKSKTREVDEEVNQPVEVSKEKFYKVTDTLKTALREKETFSLLNTFGTATEEDKNESVKVNELQEKKLKSKQFEHSRNPFKYDSSDSENERKADPINGSESTNNLNKSSHVGIWYEKFFFSPDDQRLKDGHTFFSEFVSDHNSMPFSEVRREVRQVIRAKIRNNERNKRPFRVKLGGHKKGKRFKKRS